MSQEAGTSDPPGLLVRLGNFFFYARNQLFGPVALLLAFSFRPVLLGGEESIDQWLDALGVAIAIGGQGLRALVIGTQYIQRGGKGGKVYADGLVTSGFFGHSRNPLYVGNLMVMLGLFMIHNSPWVYLLAVPFYLFAYRAIVAAEESYLLAKFGDHYRAYARDVPRWLPRLEGIVRTLTAHRFDWLKVIRKDYTQIATCLGSCILMLGWETLAYHSYAQRAAYLNGLAVLLGAVFILWLILLALKVTDHLGHDE